MHGTLTLIGRLMMASLFLSAGVGKLLGFAGTSAYIASKGLPNPDLLTAATLALELIGGVLLVINRFTMPVALAFAAFCLASAAIFHNFWTITDAAQHGNQFNHFMKNIALAGGFLFVAGSARR